MKKIFAVLLILGIAMGAFAQVKTTITADFNPDLVKIDLPTGGNAEQQTTMGQPSTGGATAVDNGFYRTAGINLLGSSGSFGQADEMFIAFDWSGENWTTHLRVNAVPVLAAFRAGAGNSATLDFILTQALDEWFVRGTAGMFGIYAGNTADRGKTNAFAGNFHPYVNSKVDNWGILVPTSTTAVQDHDVNNFARAIPFAGNYSRATRTYFSAAANFAPFTVAVAGGYTETPQSAADSFRSMNGAIRFSGEKVADMITFDAIYKFRGGDPSTKDYIVKDDPANGKPNGDGAVAHSFGVYANILAVADFGIGVGYSGLFRTYEDSFQADEKTYTAKSPLFSGIDLRFQYTGIENLTIGFNNQISLASVDASSATGTEWSVGLLGTQLAPDVSQKWFALYNGLTANYKLSDPMLVSFGVANRYFKTTENTSGTTSTESTDSSMQLSIAAYAQYTVNAFLAVTAGLDFQMNSRTQTAQDMIDIKGGNMVFGIPLRARIVY